MMRIAVVGGGIGGLAAAAFLRRAGLTATVHEQASALTEVGAGLVTAPNAVRLLRRLDVLDRFLRGAVALPAPPEESGICAFRTIVPAEAAPGFALRRAQTLWLGPGRHFVHYPIAGGQAVNVVAFAPSGSFTRNAR